jgi:hypothetical protein
MHSSIVRVRGLGFILWHSRHEFYHIMVGLIWSWFLRETWHEFNTRWIITAVIASLLPDADHFWYFFTYGKTADYTKQIKHLLKTKQWRNLTVFIESGHKENTNLTSHNIYITLLLFLLSVISFFVNWRAGIILFGAMVLHYLFDIGDDIVTLGRINPNWKRWGKKKNYNLQNQ